jgi:5-methyltetrahydropteroyltriglutamate--homocysteine methyltransferase
MDAQVFGDWRVGVAQPYQHDTAVSRVFSDWSMIERLCPSVAVYSGRHAPRVTLAFSEERSVQLPPIAATTVGSFPRPSWLASREGNDTVFNLAGAMLREAQDDATALVIGEQEAVGLDLVTDGEQRRTTFINHVLAGFAGIDLERRAPKDIRRRVGRQRLVPTVVGKVQRRAPALDEDVRFARSHARQPLKMAVPGPLTVVDTTVDETYGDEAALAMDVAAALNAELLDLQAAGCDVIQIDEPAMTRYHEKVEAFGAAALDRCLNGITVPTIVHLCFGYPGTGDPQH